MRSEQERKRNSKLKDRAIKITEFEEQKLK